MLGVRSLFAPFLQICSQPKIKGSYLYDSVEAIVRTFFFGDYLVELNQRLFFFFEKNLNLRIKGLIQSLGNIMTLIYYKNVKYLF